MSWLLTDAVDPAPYIVLSHRGSPGGGVVEATLQGVDAPKLLLQGPASVELARLYAEYVRRRVRASLAAPDIVRAAAAVLRAGLSPSLKACLPAETSAAAVYARTTGRPGGAEAWASFLRAAFDRIGSRKVCVEVVAMPGPLVPGHDCPPAPAQLPMRVLCPEPLRRRWLAGALYLTDKHVRDWMIDVRPDSVGETDDFTLVRVVDADGYPSAVAAAQVRPSLWIVLDKSPQQPFRPGRELRAGTAIAVLPCPVGTDPALVLRNFFLQIVHDHPLHECMVLSRPGPAGQPSVPSEWWQQSRLYADPTANQALRLSIAARTIDAQARAAFVASQVVWPVAAARRRGAAATPSTRGTSAAGILPPDAYRTATARGVEFSGERHGLIPLARAAAASDAVRRWAAGVATRLAVRMSSEAARQAAEQRQKRYVDLQLMRRRGNRTPQALGKGARLEPSQALRLRLHVGVPSPHSLLERTPPPIDELLPPLPDQSSYDLYVTLVPQDFLLESDATQRLELPRLGPSEPLEWDLWAPRMVSSGRRERAIALATRGRGWCSGDEAALRVNVHYRNQLLQSFRLTLHRHAVDERRYWQVGSVVCDYSRTRAFGRLDRLDGRLASLAVNRSADDTHTLMVNNDGRAEAVRWKETAMAGFSGAIRDCLLSVMEEAPDRPRFRLDVQTLAIQANEYLQAETSLRELAEAGSSLWNKLYRLPGGAPLKPLLEDVRDRAGMPIQIQLLDPDYALPWQVMYDYPIPTRPADRARPVCRGTAADGAACRCASTGDRYCIRGFWGIRHVVEQLVHAPATEDETEPVLGRRAEGVALVQGFDSAFFAQWPHDLANAAGVGVKSRDADAELLVELADPRTRPPVVVVVAHHENQGTESLPSPHVLARSAGAGSILWEGAFSRRGVAKWQKPRTLVLLLACGSGRTRVDTGASLGAMLLDHGAVGVVSTECTVYASLIARFARDFLVKLAAGKPAGDAMREINHELAVEGCPLGLAFSYLGRTAVTW